MGDYNSSINRAGCDREKVFFLCGVDLASAQRGLFRRCSQQAKPFDDGGKKNKEEKKKGKVKGGEDAAAEEKGKKKGKSKGGGGEEGKDGGKKSGKKGGKKKKKKGEADEDEQDEPEIDLAALNFGDNLDDLTKAVVFRNTLLGHHDLWGAARLEGIDLVAIEDGELDTGDGIWAGLFKDPDEDDPDESYVLNPQPVDHGGVGGEGHDHQGKDGGRRDHGGGGGGGGRGRERKGRTSVVEVLGLS
eukprot:COSAG05_NODE_6598_length_932_cov_0.984394_1_plen_245_part_00